MKTILPKFTFYEPSTIDEACRLLRELNGNPKVIAGGTDLIVNMKKKVQSPKHLISLAKISELRKIIFGAGVVKIGAFNTAAELVESEPIVKKLPGLAKGALSLGSPLIRNRATVGGNLVTARPAADLPPPLIAYDAEATLVSSSGDRKISLKDFFIGPGETVIEPDEILTEIEVSNPPPYAGCGYIKLGTREALEISLVNVAAFISLNDPAGHIESARIVLGSVAPIPTRSSSAENLLVGEKPSKALFLQAGAAASMDSKPIDDFRASAAYRKEMVKVLTARSLEMAYNSMTASPA